MSIGGCALITFASWEDRFVMGFEKDMIRYSVRTVVVFYLDKYADITADNRARVDELSGDVSRSSIELKVEDPALSWRTVVKMVEQLAMEGRDLVLDFSTMPREFVWYVLWAAERAGVGVDCLYHTPDDYGESWLSRDPHTPRMAFKLSGIADPAKRTALLIALGYDTQRARRLINWCEPNRLMVGKQVGDRFSRNQDTMDAAQEELEKQFDCEFFEVDAFGDRRGKIEIAEQINQVLETHNLILASMGPKLTALALYELQREHPHIGLVYAPAGQFNEDYSKGIGDCFFCRIDRKEAASEESDFERAS